VTDARPDRVYAMLVREGRVFVRTPASGGVGLPGGVFRPLAEDRKVELAGHLQDQLGVAARNIWAQGAFRYRDVSETQEAFCGFYSVWDWDGEPGPGTGRWLDREQVLEAPLPASLRILLLSVLETFAMRTR
jgi:hypothetical protein